MQKINWNKQEDGEYETKVHGQRQNHPHSNEKRSTTIQPNESHMSNLVVQSKI